MREVVCYNLDMTFEVGQIITLRGRSLKGKNRIRELGTEWDILSICEEDFAFKKKGDLRIAPVLEDDHDARWIHPTQDKDFEIVVIK